MNTPAKPLREAMPIVAAFIDELREAFGAEAVNPSIKSGMAGLPTFWASENGHEIGTPLDLAGRKVVGGEDMVINRPAKEFQRSM